MSRNLFIAGTGTDVGKTFLTGLILKKLKQSRACAAYYKAAMSGNRPGTDGNPVPGDAVYVKEISGIEQPLEEMCPYVYEYAAAPHLAARLEGNPVRMERVLEKFHALCRKYEYVTMEGSGGILCPICCAGGRMLLLADVIKACGLSCLLVAGAGLGTINDVGLTAFYMKARGIPLKGIILNRFQPGNRLHEDNLKQCEAVAGVRVVACVRDGAAELEIPSGQLKALYEETEAPKNDLVSV